MKFVRFALQRGLSLAWPYSSSLTIKATQRRVLQLLSAIPIFFFSVAVTAQPQGAYKNDKGRTIVVVGMAGKSDFRLVEVETGLRSLLVPTKGSVIYESDNGNITYQFSGDKLQVTNIGNPKLSYVATKLKLPETYFTFTSGDTKLFGKLVKPAGEGKFPVVVIAQGSDTQSAVDTYEEPYVFASRGIACFVYDKRGTGRSQGQTIVSFPLLASDLVAAVDTVSQLDSIDQNKIGLSGYSQGGWIAPIAAARSNKVKFVVVNYGLAMSIAEEDWHETPLKLADLGITDKKSLSELTEVNGVLHEEVKKDFQEGWYDRIDAKIKNFAGRPWLDSMRRVPTTWLGFFLNTSKENAVNYAPGMMRAIQPFYDPVGTLQKLNIPMFWLMAGEDIEAPPQITIERINQLKAQGKPFDIKIYPNTDHGILLFKKEPNKKRVYTNYAETYFTDLTLWVQANTR